jgi:hypothetical protein
VEGWADKARQHPNTTHKDRIMSLIWVHSLSKRDYPQKAQKAQKETARFVLFVPFVDNFPIAVRTM